MMSGNSTWKTMSMKTRLLPMGAICVGVAVIVIVATRIVLLVMRTLVGLLFLVALRVTCVCECRNNNKDFFFSNLVLSHVVVNFFRCDFGFFVSRVSTCNYVVFDGNFCFLSFCFVIWFTLFIHVFT